MAFKVTEVKKVIMVFLGVFFPKKVLGPSMPCLVNSIPSVSNTNLLVYRQPCWISRPLYCIQKGHGSFLLLVFLGISSETIQYVILWVTEAYQPSGGHQAHCVQNVCQSFLGTFFITIHFINFNPGACLLGIQERSLMIFIHQT